MAGLSRSSRLRWALTITLIVFVAEAAGGLASGSLALLSDAAHMLVDAAALLLSWAGMALAARPPGPKHTFGLARVEVLAALANAVLFFLLGAFVAAEAVERLARPSLPDSNILIPVAVVGLAANGLSAWLLSGTHDHDLNLRGARLHVLGDLASSAAVVAGAGLMALTGWAWVDPVLSLGLLVVIAAGAARLLLRAGRILLEMAPAGVDPREVAEALVSEIPEVKEAHHLHLWEVGAGEVHLTAHLVVEDRMLSEGLVVQNAAARVVRKRFGVTHGTFQLEPEGVERRYPLE